MYESKLSIRSTKCSSDQEIKEQLYMNAHIILVQIGTCILMKD